MPPVLYRVLEVSLDISGSLTDGAQLDKAALTGQIAALVTDAALAQHTVDEPTDIVVEARLRELFPHPDNNDGQPFALEAVVRVDVSFDPDDCGGDPGRAGRR